MENFYIKPIIDKLAIPAYYIFKFYDQVLWLYTSVYSNMLKIFKTFNISTHLNKKFSTYDALNPIKLSENYILLTHCITGLEWYSSLFVSTILLRTCIALPISVLQIKNLEKLAVVNKEMSEIVPYIKKEITFEARQKNIDFTIAKNMYNKKIYDILNSLYIRDNCHPAKNYLFPLMQLPVWISMSLALRYLAFGNYDSIVSQFEKGGLLTFSNLCMPDTHFVLPLLLLTTNLTSIELMYGRLSGFKGEIPPSNRITIFKWVTRCSAFLLFYISSIVPSVLSLYWFYSSALGLAQNQIIRRVLKSKIP